MKDWGPTVLALVSAIGAVTASIGSVVIARRANELALALNKANHEHERHVAERKVQQDALEKRLQRGISCVEKLRELEWLAENAASLDDMRDVERDAEVLQVRLRLAFGPSPFSVDYDHRGEPQDPDCTAAEAIDEIADARRGGERRAPERSKMKVRAVLAGYQGELQTMQDRLESASNAPIPPVAKKKG